MKEDAIVIVMGASILLLGVSSYLNNYQIRQLREELEALKQPMPEVVTAR